MKQKDRGINRKAWLCAMVVTSAVLLQNPGTAFAAEESEEFALDQVVVTATKTPVKQFEANANISVINKEKIEQQHYANLEQALRDVPGITLTNYGRAGFDSSNGLKINGSPNIVVLVDGVRANHAGLSFPATTYMDMENIERIEILKGSASAIYGSDAKGGVINIITRNPQEDKSVLKISGGNFSGESYSFLNEGVKNDWTYRVVAKKSLLGDAEDGRGITIPQSLNSDTLGFKVSKKINNESDIKLSYNSYKSKWMYFDGASGGGNTRGTADDYDWNVVYNYQINDRTTNVFSFKNSHYKFLSDGGSGQYASPWENIVNTLNFSDQITRKVDTRHTMVAGVDYTRDNVVSTNGLTLNNKALYVQDEWNFDQQWKLTTGLRYDEHSLAGNNTTPRLNLGYKISDRTNYYLSYSEFFVAPTPYQLFNANHGNVNLKAEDGSTKEFGINHRFNDTLVMSANIFQRKTDNVIQYNYNSNQFNNTDEDAKGWDIQLNKKLSDSISAFMGYTYTNMKESRGSKINAGGYIPKHAINIGVDYVEGKFDVGIQGRAAIDRKGKETVESFFPCDSYWIWDIGVNYKVNSEAKAFIKVNNIFDKFYAEHSAASSYTPGNWYTMPGRNVIVGMSYTF